MESHDLKVKSRPFATARTGQDPGRRGPGALSIDIEKGNQRRRVEKGGGNQKMAANRAVEGRAEESRRGIRHKDS